jgi:UDP:flavonoid glycosyltransferase YjiC (YdhE family)
MTELAGELVAAGRDVLVMSDQCNAEEVAHLCLPFRAWKRAPSRLNKDKDSAVFRDWSVDAGSDALRHACESIIFGPSRGYAFDLLELMSEMTVDAVVCHQHLFGVMAAAESKKIPVIILTGSIWMHPTVDGLPPSRFGARPAESERERREHYEINASLRRIYNEYLLLFNSVREDLGLSPLSHVLDQIDIVSKILLGTSKLFDFEGITRGRQFKYVGSYAGEPQVERVDPSVEELLNANELPLVIVCASTMYHGGEQQLKVIMEALGQMPVRGIVTLGPSVTVQEVVSGNIIVVDRASHALLLAYASAMIVPGGHGSTVRALSMGVPLICLPKGRDQFAVSSRAAATGAALVRDADISRAGIQEALNIVLYDRRYLDAARTVARRMREEGGRRSATSEIEEVLRMS